MFPTNKKKKEVQRLSLQHRQAKKSSFKCEYVPSTSPGEGPVPTTFVQGSNRKLLEFFFYFYFENILK